MNTHDDLGDNHPTVRWKAYELEQAIVEDLARLRLPTPEIAEWFRTTLEESLADLLSHQRRRAATLAKRKSELVAMQDRLLNAYLAGTVDDDTFKAKTAELKADTARVTEEIDAGGDVDTARGKAVLAVFDSTLSRGLFPRLLRSHPSLVASPQRQRPFPPVS